MIKLGVQKFSETPVQLTPPDHITEFLRDYTNIELSYRIFLGFFMEFQKKADRNPVIVTYKEIIPRGGLITRGDFKILHRTRL